MKIPNPTTTYNTFSLLVLAGLAIGVVAFSVDTMPREEPQPEVLATPEHLQQLDATVAELTEAIAEAQEAFEAITMEAEVSRCFLNQGEWVEDYGCTLEIEP